LEISGLTKLEDLVLRIDSALRDEDLVCLKTLENLKVLVIGGGITSSMVTDAGIAYLKDLPDVRELYCRSPYLTDKSLSYLSKMKSLRSLMVTGQFTDEGLSYLEELKDLSRLDIRSANKFTPAALRRLRRNLPNLQILEVGERVGESRDKQRTRQPTKEDKNNPSPASADATDEPESGQLIKGEVEPRSGEPREQLQDVPARRKTVYLRGSAGSNTKKAFKFNSKARLRVSVHHSKAPYHQEIGLTPAAEPLEIPADRMSWGIALISENHTRDLRNLVRELNTQQEFDDFPGLWINCYGTDSDLEQVAKLTRLKSLDVMFCEGITDTGLAHIRNMRQLEELHLPSRTTDAGLAHVAKLSKLWYLDMQWCDQITDKGLAHLAKLTNLKHLWVRSIPITDTGLRHIANLRQLQCLALEGGAGITDEGLAHISKLENLSALWLSDCDNITDAGLAHIAKLKELSSLDLSGKITDAGLAHIAELPSLRTLNLGKHGTMSDEMARKLKAAIPALQIERISKSPTECCSFKDTLTFDKSFPVDQTTRTGFHRESYAEEGKWMREPRSSLGGASLNVKSIRFNKTWFGKTVTGKIEFGTEGSSVGPAPQWELRVRLLDAEGKVLVEGTSTIDTAKPREQWENVVSLGRWRGDVTKATSFDLLLAPLSEEDTSDPLRVRAQAPAHAEP
jgi:hypothetical protein